MSASEQFWVVIFMAMVIGLLAGHFIDRRRQRSIAEFEQARKARKEEVERAARKEP